MNYSYYIILKIAFHAIKRGLLKIAKIMAIMNHAIMNKQTNKKKTSYVWGFIDNKWNICQWCYY